MIAKKYKWLKTLTAILTLGMAVGLPSGYAQEDEAEDTYTLNPFNITEEENVGYLARSSLAGTRLETPLRDIAATVSVITQEFLEDTGSSDLQELLVYTAGTEVIGIGGNFANPNTTNVVSGIQDQQFTDPIRNTRVRGLAAADLTRNYFTTMIAMDSYNTSRVVINRGANATLFGLGSPAGIINNQTIVPIFENNGKVSFQVGSYGSSRSEIDVERVLIEDKLSLRVALLDEEKKYQQDPAFEHDKRIFAVAEWRPYENTVIRTSFESGSITANRPRSLPPQDLVSGWFKTGPMGTPKPTHNPYNGGMTNFREPGTYVPDDLTTPDVNEYKAGTARPNFFGFGGYTFEPVLVYSNPNIAVPDGALVSKDGGADGTVFIRTARSGTDISNGATSQTFTTMRGSAENLGTITPLKADVLDHRGISKNATRGYYTNAVVQDTSLFDFMNLLLDGPNKSELEWFDALNISLEQTYLDGNAGFAYQMSKEDYRSDFDAKLSIGSRFAGFGVDVNTHTPWGDVNPNFGRVWISGSRGFINTREQTLENHRLTGYYKIDLAEGAQAYGLLSKILGKHTITGLWEDSSDNSTSIAWYQPSYDQKYGTQGDGFRTGGGFGQGYGNPATRGAHEVAHLVYVSNSIAGQNSSAGTNASNWKTKFDIQPEYTIRSLNRDTGTWENMQVGVTERAHAGSPAQNNNTKKQHIDIDSKALILQSRFFDDHIVANYGYREDSVDVFTNDNAPRNTDNSRNISPSAWYLPSTPTFSSETDATNFGIVAHLPDAWTPGGLGISLHYAESENGQVGVERSNILGENLTPVSGETTEIGFTVEINDWLSIRYNEYETLQVNETSTGLTQSFRPLIQMYAPQASDTRRAETVAYTKGDGFTQFGSTISNIDGFMDFKPFQNNQAIAENIKLGYDANGYVTYTIPAGFAVTTDLLSQGKEIEAVANVTSNWRILVNITQQEVMATNSGALLRAFVDSEVNPNLIKYGMFPTSADGTESISNWLGRNAITAINSTLAQDGALKTNEIREWRWNLVTNYEFDAASKLSGWNVGGAYRWQDRVGIGRPLIANSGGGYDPDLANPFYGPTQDRVDAWIGWETNVSTFLGSGTPLRIQLNIRNLMDDTDLIPVVADPDGGISVIRIPDERTFELRATISF